MDVFESTLPLEPMSIASAEVRMDEILAHIAEIGRQIEDRGKKRDLSWRKTAMQARDELRKEYATLLAHIERKRAVSKKIEKIRRAENDIARQDADRSTRDARKLSDQKPLWDLYLKTEVALLAILAAGGQVGPLGESLLYSAQAVPEAYRDHWLRTVYGTTWGRQAEALRAVERDQ